MDKFLKNTKGNMAMIFAVALMMIIVGAGAAVDISSMQSKKLKYQGYADAAVLAAAVSGENNIKKLNKVARKTVNSNNFSEQKLRTKLTILDDGTLHVNVTANHDMMLMGIFGKKQQKIDVVAEAPPAGAAKLLNIALVLDVTASMDGSRITALKQAATNLVNDISGGSDGGTMFSVVPFAQYVKLPLSVAGENWINVQPGGKDCWNTLDMDKSVNCRQVGTGEEAYTLCDVEVIKEVCEIRDWDGCVASREAPWHKRENYGTSKIQGFSLSDWCHTEMLPLTTNIADVKNTIDGMSTAQDTYIPVGLMWGWRALTPGAPLTEANTPDQAKRMNAILLMTDGQNTRSLGGNDSNGYEGVFHWFEDANESDATTAELCDSIKADGILIFTIAFEVTDSATTSMLKACASDAGKFYDASNAAQLKAAFADVSNGLGGDIRLSK